MSHMTREKAILLVSCSGSTVLKVNEDENGILILAYSYYYESAVEYYVSKRFGCIEQQILSSMVIHQPSEMRIVGDHLEYDV